MSLLIKGLDKAEKALAEKTQAENTNQAQDKHAKLTKGASALSAQDLAMLDAGFDLSPSPKKTVSTSEDSSANSTTKAANQKTNQPIKHGTSQVSAALTSQAANIFSSKGMSPKKDNSYITWIAGLGLVALSAMGAYYYYFLNSTPALAIAQPPLSSAPKPAPPPQVILNQETQAAEASVTGASVVETQLDETQVEGTQVEETQNAQTSVNKITEPAPIEQAAVVPALPQIELAQSPPSAMKVKVAQNQIKPEQERLDTPEQTDDEARQVLESTLQPNEVIAKPSKKKGKTKNKNLDANIASESASFELTKNKREVGINPLVMSAYDAYNAGNDKEAQQLYMQVLQRDSHNVDAMLGLGAIATRQERVADANGWYRKVLEIEPRNTTAKAAMLESESQDDPQAGESSIKNLLAKSPNDANLHATLGNLYAQNNQWSDAQQAYFDAYRLTASADNAFNLAVSLDQLGKSKLALSYYQNALQLMQQSNASSIDKAALEARISAIK